MEVGARRRFTHLVPTGDRLTAAGSVCCAGGKDRVDPVATFIDVATGWFDPATGGPLVDG